LLGVRPIMLEPILANASFLLSHKASREGINFIWSQLFCGDPHHASIHFHSCLFRPVSHSRRLHPPQDRLIPCRIVLTATSRTVPQEHSASHNLPPSVKGSSSRQRPNF